MSGCNLFITEKYMRSSASIYIICDSRLRAYYLVTRKKPITLIGIVRKIDRIGSLCGGLKQFDLTPRDRHVREYKELTNSEQN